MSAAETTHMSAAETIHFLSAYFISVYPITLSETPSIKKITFYIIYFSVTHQH